MRQLYIPYWSKGVIIQKKLFLSKVENKNHIFNTLQPATELFLFSKKLRINS